MSLLLDALKKSDQERRKRDIPDLETVHAPPPGKKRSLWLVWIFLGIVCLNGLIWWAWPRSPEPSTSTVKAVSPGAAVPESSGPRIAATAPASPETSATSTPTGPQPVAEDRSQLFLWQELPVEIRRAVVDYQLSMHYYAPQPSSRLIRLNGQLLREGQSLPDGTRVLQIREDGVVLQRGGTRFLMPGGG